MERRYRDSFNRLTVPSDANSIILDKLPTSGSRSSFGRNSSQDYLSRASSRLSRSEDAIIQQPSPQFDNEEQGDKEEYPSLWRLVLITIGLCLCVFCVALDNTIIATAIPKITDQFKSLEDVGWYGSAYLLTTCCLTLTFGKLYTFYSIKWVYLSALFIFELGSFICGITPTSVGLIIGRAIAGLGAGGLFSGAILIVSKSVPLDKRPIYTGAMGSFFGVASVAGPLLGGAFTDHVTWRWCFYINLPIGAITFLFTLIFFQAPKALKRSPGLKEQFSEFDLPGMFFFMPAVISLLLALQWGGARYPWKDARVIALLVLFGVLISIFICIQFRQQEKATIPPRLIRNRNLWGSAIYLFCVGASYFIFVYYLPIWFQAIKGASATKSGIMNIPMILGVVLTTFLSGALISLFGYYTPFIITSSIVLSIAAGLLTTLHPDSPSSQWIGYQAMLGIGLGMGLQQPMIAIQTALPAPDVPSATAIAMFSQTLGGAVFVSVGQNVFQNRLVRNLVMRAPGVDVVGLLKAGATMVRNVVGVEELGGVLRAYNDAVVETFYVGVAVGVLSVAGALAIQWLSVKKGKNGGISVV